MPISDDPQRFQPGSILLHENGRQLVVEASHRHGNRLLVRFEGTFDRTSAEGLRGALYVGEKDLRELSPGEYWEHEIVACDVVDPSGNRFGSVSGVVRGPAQDLLDVATPSGSRLVPLVKEIVVEIDITARRVVIDAPAGLMD